MKKCIYLSDIDSYYQIRYFIINQLYRYEKYETDNGSRYRIYHENKNEHSTVPDFIFHRLFKDIREYNLSKLI